MDRLTQYAEYEQAVVDLLRRLPIEKLAVVLGFISYLAERDEDKRKIDHFFAIYQRSPYALNCLNL